MVNRDKFFPFVRANLFQGRLSQSQVDGMNAILDQWDIRKPSDNLKWLAYMLATTKWETAHTMQPIEEYGKGRGRSYGVPDPVTKQTYYGRGYIQLTWKANYQKMGDLLGLDLVNNPGMALNPTTASDIMFLGMEKGLFTGVGLPRYFNQNTTDWIGARKIINGTDHDEEIAELGILFNEALQ